MSACMHGVIQPPSCSRYRPTASISSVLIDTFDPPRDFARAKSRKRSASENGTRACKVVVGSSLGFGITVGATVGRPFLSA